DAFDPPEVMTSCPRRLETTVPTQALTMLNSRTAQEQARAFAERLLREAGPETKSILDRAWLLAFGRPITMPERKRAGDFLKLGENKRETLAELCQALFNANEFVYVD